jgi:hypothetical protein
MTNAFDVINKQQELRMQPSRKTSDGCANEIPKETLCAVVIHCTVLIMLATKRSRTASRGSKASNRADSDSSSPRPHKSARRWSSEEELDHDPNHHEYIGLTSHPRSSRGIPVSVLLHPMVHTRWQQVTNDHRGKFEEETSYEYIYFHRPSFDVVSEI